MDLDLSHAVEVVYGKLNAWKEAIISMLPNFVVAIGIMVLFYFIARGVKYFTRRLLNKFLNKSALNNLFASSAYVITITIGLIVALNVLHLQQTVTSLLAGAGIIGLALGFAFQDISANYISGVFLAIGKPIRVGDIIRFKDYMGEVEEINLRSTLLRTFQGLHVIIPNKEIFQTPITNLTLTNIRRVDLDVGVSYAEDLEHVRKIAIGALKQFSFIDTQREINLYYNEFDSSSINFTIMFWIEYPDEPGFLHAQSEAIIAIKKAFDKEDITIPFPIRTLNFGIKGGKSLSDMNLSLASNDAANS